MALNNCIPGTAVPTITSGTGPPPPTVPAPGSIYVSSTGTYQASSTTTARGVNIVGTDLKTSGGTYLVTLTGFTTDQVVVFSKPLVADSGGLLLYDAYSPWPTDAGNVPVPAPVAGQTWGNDFSVYGNTGGSDTLLLTVSAGIAQSYYATAAAAYAAAAAQLPFTATGYTTYKVVGEQDPNPSDNRGGLSVKVEVRTPAWVPATPTAGSGGTSFIDVVCSEALAAGNLVNLWNNSGALNVRKANAADDTKQPDGYVLAAFASGWTARVYLPGTINNAVSGLTVGSRYFLSPSSGGAVTATAPSSSGQWSQVVGKAISATSLLFAPQAGILLR